MIKLKKYTFGGSFEELETPARLSGLHAGSFTSGTSHRGSEEAQASDQKAADHAHQNGNSDSDRNSGNNSTKNGNKAGVNTREKPKGFVESVKEFFGDLADHVGLDGEFGTQNRSDRDFSLANLDNAAREAIGDIADWAGLDGEFGTQNRAGRTFSTTNFKNAVEEGWEDFQDWVGVDGQRGHQGATDKELEFSWDKLADAWDPKELAEDVWDGIRDIELQDIVAGTFKVGLLAATVLSPVGIVAGAVTYANRGLVAETAGNLGDVIDGAVSGVVGGVYGVTADVLGLSPKTRANLEGFGKALELGFDKVTDALANPAGTVRDNVELRGDIGDIVDGKKENLGFRLSDKAEGTREDLDEAIAEHNARPSRSRREDYVKDLAIAVRHGTISADEAVAMEEAFDEANPNADREPSADGNLAEDITLAEGLERVKNDTIEAAKTIRDEAIATAKSEKEKAEKELADLKEQIVNAPETIRAEIDKAIAEKEEAVQDAKDAIEKAEDDLTDARVKADEQLRDERTKQPNNRREEVERDLFLAERHGVLTPEQAKSELEAFDAANPNAKDQDPINSGTNAGGIDDDVNNGIGGNPESLVGRARTAAREAAQSTMSAVGDKLNDLEEQLSTAVGREKEALEGLRDGLREEYQAASSTVSSLMGRNNPNDTSLAGSIDADVNSGLDARANTGRRDGSPSAREEALAAGETLPTGEPGAQTPRGETPRNPFEHINGNSDSDRNPNQNNNPNTNTPTPNAPANTIYAKYKDAASTFLAIEGLDEGRGEAFIIRMRKEGIPAQDIEDIVVAAGRKKHGLVEGSGFATKEAALDALISGDHPSTQYQRIFDEGQFHIPNAELHVASAQAVRAVEDLNNARTGKDIDEKGPLTGIVNVSENIGKDVIKNKETSYAALKEDINDRMERDPNYGPRQAAEREQYIYMLAANIVVHDEKSVTSALEGNLNRRRFSMTGEAYDSIEKDLEFAKALASDPDEYPGFAQHIGIVSKSGLDVGDSVAVLAHSHTQSSETRAIFGAETQEQAQPTVPAQAPTAEPNSMDAMLAGFTAPTGISISEGANANRYGGATEVAMADGVVFDGEVTGDVVAGNGTDGTAPQQEATRIT